MASDAGSWEGRPSMQKDMCRTGCLDMWGMGLLTSDIESHFFSALFEVNSISILKLPSDLHVCCPESERCSARKEPYAEKARCLTWVGHPNTLGF